jgi:hypothetical protein
MDGYGYSVVSSGLVHPEMNDGLQENFKSHLVYLIRPKHPHIETCHLNDRQEPFVDAFYRMCVCVCVSSVRFTGVLAAVLPRARAERI